MNPQVERSPSHSLAERFWGLARARPSSSTDPVDVVRHVLEVLDALEAGEVGAELTVNTVSFLHLLRQSEMRGDLHYASPEQARGEAMDERSLVFSVGVLIFEKLTGRHPFGAEASANRVARIRRAEMASGVTYFQTISGRLRTILLRCMGPFPEDRWKNLAELRIALQEFVDGDTSGSRRYLLPALPAPDGAIPEPPPRRRLARASSRALTIAADREGHRRNVSEADRNGSVALQQVRWSSRVFWMGAGAAAASAVLLLAGTGRGESKAKTRASEEHSAVADRDPATVRAMAVQVVEDRRVEAVAPSAAPTGVAPTEVAAAQQLEPAVETLPSPEPDVAASAATSASFSVENYGETALAASRNCFESERMSGGLEFGLSVRLDPGRDAPRVFFGKSSLLRDERSCLKDIFLGQPVDPRPTKPMSISYSFYVGAVDGRVKARYSE